MDKYIKSYGSFRKYESPKKSGLFGLFRKKNKYSRVSNSSNVPSYAATNRPSFIRPRTIKNYRGKIIFFLFGGVILSWAILMIYLPYFRVNKVNFEGLKIIDPIEIESYISAKYLKGGIIPHNNYFFINAKEVERDISSKYAIDSVVVEKIFPGLINIKIEEKITTIIYDNEASYSLLDKDGMVIKIIEQYAQIPTSTTTTAPMDITSTTDSNTEVSTSTVFETHIPDFRKLSVSYSDIPILLDMRRQQIFEKQANVLNPNLIKSIIDWQKALRDEGIGEIRYFETDNPPAGLKVHLNAGWYLLIQPDNPIAEQINNLKTILANRDIKPIEYIDLRFGERVFWK